MNSANKIGICLQRSLHGNLVEQAQNVYGYIILYEFAFYRLKSAKSEYENISKKGKFFLLRLAASFNKTLHIQIERKARRTWQCPTIKQNSASLHFV